MNGIHTTPHVITNGYQLCEGCGECLVNGDRVMYGETPNGRYFIHAAKACATKAIEYLTFKEHTERQLFPHSSAEIYGDVA